MLSVKNSPIVMENAMDRNEEREVDRMIAARFSTCRADGDWRPDFQRGLLLLRERRRAARRGKRSVLLAAGALAAAIPIMAFPFTRAFAAHCVSACVQQTVAVRRLLAGGEAASKPSSTYIAPAYRKAAPDFALTDAFGRTVRLSDFRGKVVLLNFWATWCSPCEQEIPWFIDFQRQHEQQGFTVLGISVDSEGWNAVRPYLERKKVNYPVMLTNDETAGLFGGLQSIPLTIVIDRSGRIAAIHAGLCRRYEYEGDINTVLNE